MTSCFRTCGPAAAGVLVTLAFSLLAASAQQLAFPTAEGFGRFAEGGRGGEVHIVTTLADSGPGSLRACAEAAGPRTCVFEVSGEIKLRDAIRIQHPYITIAGQTAPGDGVMLTIRGGPSLVYPMLIETHDVIVRHLSIRPGPSAQPSSNVDALVVSGQDIILDHLSLSWGTDEILSIFGNSGTTGSQAVENAARISVQWSMIYEGLRRSSHPKGSHSNATYMGYAAQEITFHHNLIAHSSRRNPNLGITGQFDFLNNIVYNGSDYFAEVYNRHGTSNLNWVGNMAIAGPDTPRKLDRNAVNLFANEPLGTHNLFLFDNLDINRRSGSQAERSLVDPKDWQYIRSAPVGSGTLSLPWTSITRPQQALQDVLAFAGATMPVRDSADRRVADELRRCGGGIIDHPDERGGWPLLLGTVAPADTDRDGMPDDWEQARGLDPAQPNDRNGDADGDGYTNLEEYLNARAGDDDGFRQGKGRGRNHDTRCWWSFEPGSDLRIKAFEVFPQAVPPGGEVTVYYDAVARTCDKSWAPGSDPRDVGGLIKLRLFETQRFDFFCSKDGQEDWASAIVFVNDEGTVPRPSVTLRTDKTSYAPGEPVTLTWMTGDAGGPDAGECEASGAWSGIKPVIGAQTFEAAVAGDYTLACHGPGGTSSASVRVAIGSPGFAPGSPVRLSAVLAWIRASPGGARVGSQREGAQGQIVGGPFRQDGFTWWDVDFASGVDGWVTEAKLAP